MLVCCCLSFVVSTWGEGSLVVLSIEEGKKRECTPTLVNFKRIYLSLMHSYRVHIYIGKWVRVWRYSLLMNYICMVRNYPWFSCWFKVPSPSIWTLDEFPLRCLRVGASLNVNNLLSLVGWGRHSHVAFFGYMILDSKFLHS